MHDSSGSRRKRTRRSPRLTIAAAVRCAGLSGAATLAALASSTSYAADVGADEGLQLQEVVVTGSLIKRTDSETPSAVQVMSSEQIQQSGYTNISDVLRNISANGANTLSQSFGQAFAAGASGVSLCGLTVGDTLTLIDGHRTVAYPLADDNQRSFGSVQASFFSSQAQQMAGSITAPGGYATTNYPTGLYNPVFSPTQPIPKIVPNPPAVITVPANYPGNPTGTVQDLVHNFHELGLYQVDTNTNTYRLLAELNGQAAGWDLDGSAGAMYSHMAYKLYGNIEWAQLQAALNNGYVVGQNPSPNGASLFAPPQETTPTSSLSYLEAHASRPLLQLPGGPLSVALGAQYFHKVQHETAPATAVAGVEAEQGGTIFVVGSQEDAAAFAEFDAAVLKQLELNAAVRYDHYDTYGSSTTPKFGVKFQPIDEVALRGTWGKGFRAPSAAEGGQSGELFGAGSYTDLTLCPTPSNAKAPGNFPSQCSFGLQGYQVSNPDLKAVYRPNSPAASSWSRSNSSTCRWTITTSS